MTLLFICCSFNRSDKTIKAISSLLKQVHENKIEAEFVLVDDASLDGTVTKVNDLFGNKVTVYETGGGYYWARAMTYGFLKSWDGAKFDGLVVFNDDVSFFDDSISSLITFVNQHSIQSEASKGVAVVGSTVSQYSGKTTYGAQRRIKNLLRPQFSLLDPGAPSECIDSLNMNYAFINSHAITKTGFLSDSYHHSLADFDFGLNLRRMGGSIFSLPSYVGMCERNSSDGTWRDVNYTLSRRYRLLQSPKGMPLKERYAFVARNFSSIKLFSLILPYCLLAKDQFIRVGKFLCFR
jgi:GT2 family glycosyltransferase